MIVTPAGIWTTNPGIVGSGTVAAWPAGMGTGRGAGRGGSRRVWGEEVPAPIGEGRQRPESDRHVGEGCLLRRDDPPTERGEPAREDGERRRDGPTLECAIDEAAPGHGG